MIWSASGETEKLWSRRACKGDGNYTMELRILAGNMRRGCAFYLRQPLFQLKHPEQSDYLS